MSENEAFMPTEVRAPRGARVMHVTFEDGHAGVYPHEVLRGFCPCAQCQGHSGPIRFVPGGDLPATVTGFGAVFTDVDLPDGSRPNTKRGNRKASTLMAYFDADGELLFSSFVPASPGDGSLSFFGIVFRDARIARVRITSGNVAPGPDDQGQQDIVMMDDFIYGEPQP